MISITQAKKGIDRGRIIQPHKESELSRGNSHLCLLCSDVAPLAAVPDSGWLGFWMLRQKYAQD
jgi:hypothetical protein